MISVRVNEIFSYLSSDRKKEQCKKLASVSGLDRHHSATDSGGKTDVGVVRTSSSQDDANCTTGPPSSPPAEAPVEIQAAVLRKAERKSGSVQDATLSSRHELNGVNGDCHALEHVKLVAATPEISGQHEQPLQKKSCEKVYDDATAAGSPQTDGCKAEENWKLVTNHGKRESRTAAARTPAYEPGVLAACVSQAKGRKKRNRRNRDRAASAATLDYRSTSCSTVHAVEPPGKNRISETKSFHAPPDRRSTGKEQSSAVSKPPGHHGDRKTNHVAADSFCRQSSAGDDGRDRMTSKPPVKNERQVSPLLDAAGQPADCCPEMSSMSLDELPKPQAVVNSSMMDASKIDALDSFDDIMPTTTTTCRQDMAEYLTEQSAADGEEWTAVNRRYKKLILSACGMSRKVSHLDSIASVTGANMDVERHDDKLVITIRGASEQIANAVRLVTTLANNVDAELAKKRNMPTRSHVPPRIKNMTNAGRKPSPDGPKSEKPGAVSPECDVSSYEGLLTGPESTSVPPLADYDRTCQAGFAATELVSPMMPQPIGPPGLPQRASSVKEYSLFDNAFSKTVESVLKNDICVSSSSWSPFASESVAPMGVSVAPSFDQALLSKAPGYRVSTASPFAPAGVERPRKYSNDSSSSLSSAKSCDDSPTGRVVAPPSQNTQKCGNQPADAFHYDLPSTFPPVCRPSAGSSSLPPVGSSFSEFCPPATSMMSAGSVGQYMALGGRYSSPNEPMTLPRISTDLNPNAPDFVFRPATATVQQPACQSVHPSVPRTLSPSTTSGFHIPSSQHAASSAWSDTLTPGGKSVVPATANSVFDLSGPLAALVDSSGGCVSSASQWAAANHLMTESPPLR